MVSLLICLHVGSAMRSGPCGFSLAWKETDICLRGDVTTYIYIYIYTHTQILNIYNLSFMSCINCCTLSICFGKKISPKMLLCNLLSISDSFPQTFLSCLLMLDITYGTSRPTRGCKPKFHSTL